VSSNSFVPNLVSPIVSVKNRNGDEIGKGFVIAPWNSFFQQFTQKAAASSVPTSPFTPNTQGNLFFTSGTPVITLTRGSLVLTLTGQKIIPVAVGDSVTWSGATTVNFLGTFSQ